MTALETVLQSSGGRTNDRPDSVWDYVSPSRLNLWLKCPLAFRLRYIDGIRSPTTPALFLGKQVHAGLEMFYRCRQRGETASIEDLKQSMERGWEAAAAAEGVTFSSCRESERCQIQAIQLVNVYIETLSSEKSVPLIVEATLEAPLIDPRTGEDFGIPLLGIVDLVLEEQTGPIVVDFKTAARNEPAREQLHEVQLGCYAYLSRQAIGRRESALEIRRLIKTKVPQVVCDRWKPRTDAHYGRLFAVIRAYLDQLNQSRFVYRPGLGCSFCDYQSRHCQEWSGD